jgi:hypothetical protein
MADAKAYRTYIRIKSERLSVSMKLTLHKALIRSVMAYAYPGWELAADTCLLKLLRLKNEVPHSTGNFSRCTPVPGLHMAFNLPYVYDYITSRTHTKS